MRDRPARPYGQLWMMDVEHRNPHVSAERRTPRAARMVARRKVLAFQGSIEDKSGLLSQRADGSGVAFLASTNGTNSPLPVPEGMHLVA